jgi:MFS family permease
MGGFRNSLGILRETEYRRLFFGRTISLVGDGMAPVAIAFAVLDLTGSATDLGIVLATHSLLIIVLVLAGGVFADRISPRLAMLRADLVRLAAMGAIAALLIAGVAQIWELAVLYAIEGAATAFFNPASNAIVPQIVPTRQLQPANALLNLSRSLGKFVGPALAGILLALGTPGWAIAFDAATFGASAFFLFLMHAPPLADREEPAFFAELRRGWKEFSSRTWLWTIVASAAFTNAIFFPCFQVLGPTVARAELGGSSAWAAIAAALGIGSLIGGALALRIRPRRPLLVGEGFLVCIGLPVALLAVPAAVVPIALSSFALGVSLSLAEIFYDTTEAQQVPTEALSRVAAYDWLGSLSLEPLGLALIGPLAAGIGISTTLWLGAAVATVVQVAVVCVPSVRRMEALSEAPTPLPPPRPIDPGD